MFQTHSFNTYKAFSALELLFVIMILGILSIIATNTFKTHQQKTCLKHLKTQLFLTQEHLSMLYLRDFLHTNPNTTLQAYNLLNKLHSQKTCGFVFESVPSPRLIAHIQDTKLVFTIQPSDLKTNPRIFCNLNAPLCKEFFGRKLNK